MHITQKWFLLFFIANFALYASEIDSLGEGFSSLLQNIKKQENVNELLLQAVKDLEVVNIKRLIKQGADPNLTVQGIPILSTVAGNIWKGKQAEDILVVLIQGGANINQLDNAKKSPLNYLMDGLDDEDNMKNIKYFVQHGANLNFFNTSLKNFIPARLIVQSMNQKNTIDDSYANKLMAYFKLVEKYYDTRTGRPGELSNFLKNMTRDERNDILMIALFQGNQTTLTILEKNKYYPFIDMLKISAQEDINKPINYLLTQLGVTDKEFLYILGVKNASEPSTERKKEIDLIKNIYETAKQNKNTIFVKAVVDYFINMRTLKGLKIPDDIAKSLLEYN